MEDLTCPLCLKVFLDPVSISCGHTFCHICAKKAYKKTRKCPICRVAFSLNQSIAVTHMLKSYIEKHFLEEVTQRRIEEQEDLNSLSPDIIPILFLSNFVVFPGATIVLQLFEPRYIMMLEMIMAGDKTFGIISNFFGQYIGFTVEIISEIEHGRVRIISGHTKHRLSLTTISPYDDQTVKVNLSHIGPQQYNTQILWVCDKVYIQDIQEESNSTLENSLIEFTDSCINSLGRMDFEIVRRSFSRQDLSFFMINVLKLEIDLILQAFVCESYNQRLEIIQNFVRNKRPSRMLVKVNRNTSVKSKISYVIIAVGLLIIYFSKT